MSPLTRSRNGLALALGLTLAAATARGDVVQLIAGSAFKPSQGGAVRGQVTAESPTEVAVSLGASTVNVPTDQIESIEYQGQPAALQLGETNAAAGRAAEAIAQFQKAATEAAGKPFVIEAAKFGEATLLGELALTEPDRVKEALTRLTGFLQAYPKGRHVVATRESLARLQLHAQDYKGAEANIAELAKLAPGAGRAAVLKARLLLKEGDFQGAAADLDRLIAAAPENSAQQVELKLVKAETLIAASKYDEAESLVRQVIAAAPAEDAAVQSKAYNTLGDCQNAAARPKDALLAYLHVDLLYSKDKEEHPRALRRIEQLFRKMGQLPRADEYGQRLKQDYPNSPWAKQPPG
ncbi:tetratricopeptide repeat protein [Paludisphaera mucosa]|uniref:Tetratricopeptide repeat protein n=1 Tax=Paludisphaera mucosa TaxID=3030827 RepID=A0ABT6FDY5_9BACT|nr:tetratricopeptide repeat protein [Paludisphaera mucosa]MDG3005711.1 tetratricopeptide repeat protein [Paludisphaera mucosa]